MPAVPPVEPADHADADRVRRPHREMYAFRPVDGHRMRAHLLVGAEVRALAEKVEIEIGDLEREPVRVFQFPDVPIVAGHPQPVRKRLAAGKEILEQPLVVNLPHRHGLAGRLVDHLDLRREKLERMNHDAGVGALDLVHAEHVIRRSVVALHDRFDGSVRQEWFHATSPRVKTGVILNAYGSTTRHLITLRYLGDTP